MFVNGSITLSSIQKKGKKSEKNRILQKFAWAEFLILKTASGHSFDFFGKYLPLSRGMTPKVILISLNRMRQLCMLIFHDMK
jgi:hypothetical protein